MSNTRVSCIITDQNITVDFNGQTHIVSRQGNTRSMALSDALIKALKEKRYDMIPDLVSASKRVETYGKGNFQVDSGRIKINGTFIPDQLARRILTFQEQGLPHEPLVKFAENLQKNPSYRAVNELFQFLEKNNHPITDNGCFIAYKKIREDFTDCHTGTFDNSVGKVVEMPRNQVNEDPTQTCSHGLHVANWDYAHNFYGGGVMVEVEVNPRDVVAVPVDYDRAKMRTCAYTVLGVVTQPHADGVEFRCTSRDSVEEAPNLDKETEEEICPWCEDPDCYDCECGDDPRDACEDE